MKKKQSLFHKLKLELRLMCIRRQPKWLWYDIGENNWIPTLKEQIYRGVMNVLFFVLTIELMFYIVFVALKTPFFLFLKDIAQALGYTELIWLIYGIMLGIAGSLLFGSIANHQKSVLSRIQTSLVYIVYFGVFIVALNFFLWLFAATL